MGYQTKWSVQTVLWLPNKTRVNFTQSMFVDTRDFVGINSFYSSISLPAAETHPWTTNLTQDHFSGARSIRQSWFLTLTISLFFCRTPPHVCQEWCFPALCFTHEMKRRAGHQPMLTHSCGQIHIFLAHTEAYRDSKLQGPCEPNQQFCDRKQEIYKAFVSQVNHYRCHNITRQCVANKSFRLHKMFK